MTTTSPVSVSIKEAAKITGLSTDKLYVLNRRGELAGAYRMGGRVLVHVPTLLAWIESQATKVSTGVQSMGTPPAAAPSPRGTKRPAPGGDS